MKNHIRSAVLSCIGLTCWAIVAVAADTGLTVERPWARPAAAGQTSAIYLTVTDTGPSDALIGARTPVADDAQLHQSKMRNGVMEMRAVDAAPVAPGEPLVLAPGGYHIMLMGLKQPLKEGDTVPVTLVFQKAGTLTTQVIVQRSAPKP